MLFTILTGQMLLGSTALAGTIGVYVDAAEGPVAAEGAEAVVWHALQHRDGHEPVVLNGAWVDVVPQMRAADLERLLHVDIRWRRQVVELGAGMVAAPPAPDVHLSEYRLQEGVLREVRAWNAVGAAAVYRQLDEQDVVSYPEVSLQEALSVAVRQVAAPVWTRSEPRLRIPVIVAADDDYRAFYGPRWRHIASRRVERAAALLSQAGLTLDIQGWQEWVSPEGVADLTALLEAQARLPTPHGRYLRIGFTQQTKLGGQHQDLEDVGRAFLPGTDVILADQASPPGHLLEWDEAEEGVAVAHEVLHALGAPHLKAKGFVMSDRKSSLTYQLAPSTVTLARTAAQVRWSHWDPEVALALLEGAAEGLLYAHSDLQVDYISENLAEGPGVPPPFSVDPSSMSALANVALAKYYYHLSRQQAAQGDAHREMASAYTQAALRMAPTSTVAMALAGALDMPSPDVEPTEAPSESARP